MYLVNTSMTASQHTVVFDGNSQMLMDMFCYKFSNSSFIMKNSYKMIFSSSCIGRNCVREFCHKQVLEKERKTKKNKSDYDKKKLKKGYVHTIQLCIFHKQYKNRSNTVYKESC